MDPTLIMRRTGLGFLLTAHTTCKHDRLDEKGEKIDNFRERTNDKTSKVSQNIVIRDCGYQQNSYFSPRMIGKLAYKPLNQLETPSKSKSKTKNPC